MPSGPRCKLLIGACLWGLLAGCAGHLPPQVASQVAWNLSFAEIRQHSEQYVGRLVVLGGIVRRIEAVDEGYRVIVSELPLDGSSRHRPAVDQPSRGLFMVMVPRQRYPSGLRPGVEVTVAGEIRGPAEVPGDDGTTALPRLDERYLHVWGPSWWPHLQLGIWGGIGL
jgi:starvation-inducible outer membrane lipoprotein